MRTIYLPPWRIDLDVRPGVPRLVSDAALARLAAAALDAAGARGPATIGIRLTVDAELSDLNARHMDKVGPTDVLSFPLLAAEAFPPHPGARRRDDTDDVAGVAFPLPPGSRQPLGDVVVSVERAIEQANLGRGGQTGDVRWSPADELRLLVTHGVLHICGWDHAAPEEEAAMRALETRLLTRG